jgi:hypothetical protein
VISLYATKAKFCLAMYKRRRGLGQPSVRWGRPEDVMLIPGEKLDPSQMNTQRMPKQCHHQPNEEEEQNVLPVHDV